MTRAKERRDKVGKTRRLLAKIKKRLKLLMQRGKTIEHKLYRRDQLTLPRKYRR